MEVSCGSLTTLFSFAGGSVAGMVSKASFLHRVCDFCTWDNKWGKNEGTNCVGLGSQGGRSPSLIPSAGQQDEDIIQHPDFLLFPYFLSPQFCFLYPEMVDKLVLLENLGFLLAPEVRFQMSFPSLFKTNRYFLFICSEKALMWLVPVRSHKSLGSSFWQAQTCSLLCGLRALLGVALGGHLVALHILQSLSTEIHLSVPCLCTKGTGTSV